MEGVWALRHGVFALEGGRGLGLACGGRGWQWYSSTRFSKRAPPLLEPIPLTTSPVLCFLVSLGAGVCGTKASDVGQAVGDINRLLATHKPTKAALLNPHFCFPIGGGWWHQHIEWSTRQQSSVRSASTPPRRSAPQLYTSANSGAVLTSPGVHSKPACLPVRAYTHPCLCRRGGHKGGGALA